MNKRMVVKTNDPADSQFYISVFGTVDKVADISPSLVSLNGRPGQTLTALVQITPESRYPFSILGLHQEFGNGLITKLIKPEKGEKTWKLSIEVKSDKPNSLYEIITLKTDSSYKPKLQVRVYAIYAEPDDSNPLESN